MGVTPRVQKCAMPRQQTGTSWIYISSASPSFIRCGARSPAHNNDDLAIGISWLALLHRAADAIAHKRERKKKTFHSGLSRVSWFDKYLAPGMACVPMLRAHVKVRFPYNGVRPLQKLPSPLQIDAAFGAALELTMNLSAPPIAGPC